MSFYRKSYRPRRGGEEPEKCADPAKARARALDALSAREMTSTQLYERLCARFTEQAAAAAVAEMVELDYVNDDRYAETRAHGLLMARKSRRAAAQNLRQKGDVYKRQNCYIELPTEWEGNLKLTDSEQYDGAVELRTVDEDQPVMTVRLAQTAASSTGWTKLGIVASRQMQARLAPDVEIQDADRCV